MGFSSTVGCAGRNPWKRQDWKGRPSWASESRWSRALPGGVTHSTSQHKILICVWLSCPSVPGTSKLGKLSKPIRRKGNGRTDQQ